ncbi:MAG: flagellar M-ring protein FliF C-terminal domain-containing protein, partial [Paracoccaceae bacterium]
DNSSSSQDTVTRERTNYEVSETTRELLRVPGSIRRISIAVLVDGVVATDAATSVETWTARSDAELQDLRDLVASAVGFDATRGDVITLKSLQFEPVVAEGTEVSVSLLQKLNLDVMRLIQIFFLSLVAVALGMFVVRPILSRAPLADLPGLPPPGPTGPVATIAAGPVAGGAVTPLAMAAGPPPVAAAGPAIQTAPSMQIAQPLQALTGEIDDGTMLPADLSVIQNIPATLGGMAGGGGRPEPLPVSADPVERLRQMITDRQDETVDILRTWIDDGEERV